MVRDFLTAGVSTIYPGTKLVPLVFSGAASAGSGGQCCRALPLVGRKVATLVFFPASTPARIVSARFFVRRLLVAGKCFLECVDYTHLKILEL